MVLAICVGSQHGCVADLLIGWVGEVLKNPSSSSSSAFPSFIYGLTILGEVFTYVTRFLIQPLRSEEDRTHDAASCRTVNPTHYQLSYPHPPPLPPTPHPQNHFKNKPKANATATKHDNEIKQEEDGCVDVVVCWLLNVPAAC